MIGGRFLDLGIVVTDCAGDMLQTQQADQQAVDPDGDARALRQPVLERGQQVRIDSGDRQAEMLAQRIRTRLRPNP